MNTDRNEKLFDAMVKTAFEEAVQQEMDSLPSREKLNEMYPSSEAFDKQIMAIIAKEEKTYKRRQASKQALKVFTRIAASIAILFTVSTLALMSVETSRVFIFNAFMGHPHAAMEFAPFGGEIELRFDVVEDSLPDVSLTEEELSALWDSMFDPETVQIIVDGEAIEAPAPFVNRETGLPMLPVTYIAQALGYPVYIDDQDPAIVTIGHGITFTVGIDSYNYMRMEPIQLHAAPEMHDGVVFVPKHFFGEVMPVAAYIMDGNIIVSSDQVIGGDIEFVD